MEAEEQERLKDKQVSDNEEILRLEGVVQRLQDEMKNIALKSQTFIRERNMFRQMLQHKGQLGEDGQPQSPAPRASDDGVSVTEVQNLAEALRNLQAQYDQYKSETLETQNTINEQFRQLAAEKSELEIQVARINSQLEMAGGK
jgi:nucleoprotein TPR